MGEKLYEYKRTNGIRVMFVKRGNESTYVHYSIKTNNVVQK